MSFADYTRRGILRQAVKTAGLTWMTGSLAAASANASPFAETATCAITGAPGLTEGPYFVDEILNRIDIRVDPSDGVTQKGTQLDLTLNFSRVDNCSSTPLVGACIDIWHCGALGDYSDVGNFAGKKFLRGYQMTDRNGQVKFTTIFPGWYSGRAVHIHFKVRTFSQNAETYEFTSQFFFDDAVIDQVLSQGVYAAHGLPDTRNATDGIYRGAASLGPITSEAGSYLYLTVSPGSTEGKLKGEATVVLDVSAGSTPDQTAPGGGGMPPPPGGGTPPPGGGGPGGPPPGM
ncbi:MAG: hypothetical protein JST65_22775 [Acidobacteria bacterium]|nr:hypothetical protein [Acidobacteriota bacterium]